MSDRVIFYPILNNELLTDLSPEVHYSFSYFFSGENKEIECEIENRSIILKLKDSSWNFDDFDLELNLTLSLKKLGKLF